MDYCHPCQRHLNGALACAGCGTPVEALSHYATPALSGHEPDAERVKALPSAPGGRRRRSRGATEPAAGGRGARGSGSRRGSANARASGGSRRARRDERGGTDERAAGDELFAEDELVARDQPVARDQRDGRERRGARGQRGGRGGRGRPSHRRRGRTALLVILGVVLAAGALSLAELAIEPKGDDGASDYVREATDVTTAPVPKPSSSHDIDRPGPVDSPSTVPVTDAHTSGTGPPGTATGTGGGAPGGAGSAPPEATTTPSGDATSSTDPSSGPSPSGSPRDPSGTPTGHPSHHPNPPSPTPSPTKSESCWLIFCF
ncbi:SCO2400 family protein [Streptomyces sp. 900116325]